MNFRQRQLRKFYMALTLEEPLEFLWYTENNKQILLRYYGTKRTVKVPEEINDKTVTALECTTFYGNSDIETVKLNDNITKIF